MAYNSVYKKSVQRDLKRLSKAEVQRVLNQIEEELLKNAATYPVLKGQFTGLRKYCIGVYKATYAILGDDVLGFRIGHRKEVYIKKICQAAAADSHSPEHVRAFVRRRSAVPL